MNPSESQIFWKRLLQEDLLKFRKGNSLNYQKAHQQTNAAMENSIQPTSTHSKLIHLQKQYDMLPSNPKGPNWNHEEQQKFFALHRELGNKWGVIEKKMEGKTDNCLKNKFYSTVRKGFRKLNNYIANIKRKRSHPLLSENKLLKPEFITKLIAVADKNFQEKYEAKPIAINSSIEIQTRLIQLARGSNEYEQNAAGDFVDEQQLLQKIHDFNRNCKKRKGKKKHRKGEKIGQEQEQSSISEEAMVEVSPKKSKRSKNLAVDNEEVIHYVERILPPMQQEKNHEKMSEKGDQFRVIKQDFDLFIEQADESQKNRFFNFKTTRSPSGSTSFAGGHMNSLIAPSPIVNSINNDFYLTPGGHYKNSRSRISRSSFNSNFLGNVNQKDGDQTLYIAENLPFGRDSRANEIFFKSTELRKQMQDKSYNFDRSLSTLPGPGLTDNFLKKYQQWPILESKDSELSLDKKSVSIIQKDKGGWQTFKKRQ